MSSALDHRLALVLYALLLLAALAPVVIAWLRLLPAEREPFAIAGERPARREHDAFAIFLLANITLSWLLRFPGIEALGLSAPVSIKPSADRSVDLAMIGFIWFGFTPLLAAAYSLVKRNPLRWPLVVAGLLTLALWLAAPLLLGSIRGTE